jgi:acetyl/propionyl-CoA carboxylase alpha subunit
LNRIIRIDGEPVEPARDADLVETEPGVWSVLVDGRSYEVRVEGDEIVIGEHRFRFEIDDPRVWKRSRSSAGVQGKVSIIAPMPGRVVRILVNAGNSVVAGQGLIVIEAMKMQNELKAPRDGRVTAIGVKPDDRVNAGAVLATIE